jgi:hypothetical protein
MTRAAVSPLLVSCAAALAVAQLVHASGTAEFRALPFVPGKASLVPANISGNGRFVVGTAKDAVNDPGKAFVYDITTNTITLLGGSANMAIGASGDGGVIVGQGANSAIKWGAPAGPTTSLGLGAPSSAVATSASGSIIVGNDITLGAFKIDGPNAPVALGKLDTFDDTVVSGTTADGQTYVGSASQFVPGNDTTPDVTIYRAAKRVGANAWVSLGTLDGAVSPSESFATAIAPTSGKTVGFSRIATGTGNSVYRAFVHDDASTMGTLQFYPGLAAFSNYAYDITDAGVIVGSQDSSSGPFAVVWSTPTSVPIDLNAQLVAWGISLPGWSLTSAVAISDDGAFIVGTGIDPTGRAAGWVIAINGFGVPPVNPCPMDYNADQFITLDDLGDYITDYYTLPPIPGGAQPDAPTYPSMNVGFGIPCPDAPDAPSPYAVDAYRVNGYRVGFSPDLTNSCPLAPEVPFPNLDNLGDFITAYYAVPAGPCVP